MTERFRPRLGLTLPQFLDDVGPLLAVARASEDVGLDGVFVFDHLFRTGPSGRPRPSHEMAATLGAVIAETRQITIGTLVARVPLRPAAVLAAVFASARRLAGERIVAGLGAGDHESRPEHDQFGPPYESVAFRLAQLRTATDAVRAVGVPVWIGGQHPDVVALALERADGWNRWGGDPAEVAARMAVDVAARGAMPAGAPGDGDAAGDDRAVGGGRQGEADDRRAPGDDRAAGDGDAAGDDRGLGDHGGGRRARGDGFTTSWGGVVDLATLTAERLGALLALDVDWVILGARHPGDPADVHRLGRLLREVEPTGDGRSAARPSQ